MTWEETLTPDARREAFALFDRWLNSDEGVRARQFLRSEFSDRTSFSLNTHEMAFNEGQRHVVLTLDHRAAAAVQQRTKGVE